MKNYLNLNLEICEEKNSSSMITIEIEEDGDSVNIVVPKPYEFCSTVISEIFINEFPDKDINIYYLSSEVVSIFDYLKFKNKYSQKS